MRTLLLAVALLVLPQAQAQPILKNAVTTNTLANAVGVLTNNGSGGLGFSTNITQSVTYNNITTTNLTVLNQLTVSNLFTTNITVLNNLTVSNIVVTNVTVQNNLVVSNLYSVNGNHALLIVTNAVRMPWVTLTLTGTNVAQIDLNAGSMFRVYLAANAYFGTVANHPGTNTSQSIQIALIQDGTGSRTVTMTNTTWFLNGSGSSTNAVPSLNTNANGITILSFVTHPTNSVALVGVPATISP